MNNKKVINHIVDWIKSYVDNHAPLTQSLVVGVSGGIDSALTSILCSLTGIRTIAVKIPLKSSNIDLSRIHCDNLIAKFVNTEILEIDLTDTYECFFKTCKSNGITSPLGFANSKSRMRMILLYQIAATYSGLVVGTGNKVEDFGVGFYTKYGDGGVDVSPIADLTKTEVRLLAEELSIHKDIISAAPSDGLWDDGRTDEQQLGLSYDDIEDAMSNEKSPHREAYISVRNKNIHKMRPIPVCTIEDKD